MSFSSKKYDVIVVQNEIIEQNVREALYDLLKQNGVKLGSLSNGEDLINDEIINALSTDADASGIVMPFNTNRVSGTESFFEAAINRGVFSRDSVLSKSPILMPTRPFLMSGAMSVLSRLGAINPSRISLVKTDEILNASEEAMRAIDSFVAQVNEMRTSAEKTLNT